jgi:hypothetical protein
MYADKWPEEVNLVRGVLSNSLSTRLNNRTPMKAFTGHAEMTPLALMLKDNVPVNAPLDFIKAQKFIDVEKLSKACQRNMDRWRRKLHVIARLILRIITTRRTCGRQTFK